MRRNIVVVLLLVLVVASMGCFRATYTQLYGQDNAAPVAFEGPPDRDASAWHHFFIFGLLPTEQRIESGKLCGSRGVREIQTQETFIQGLFRSFTNSLYSPWNGQTRCN